MGTDDVRFFCYFDGNFIDEDTNFKYNGGKTKLIKVPKSTGFTSFKQKIQEMTKLPVNGTELKIKCGVPADESTVIAVDVDDDESLQSVMEDSKYVRTYILKDVPPATTFTAAQRVSQSNVDGHDIWVELSRVEELLNLSDSNNKGVNSSYLRKRMNSLLRNPEHSESSEVNMPEKWYVKSNVDDHQIILSRSSHSRTLDEMLYKTNQESSQVSRCSQSSVPSQLSDPLIRNHQDNEADNGNRQESVVVKEIQFMFQRKETIISSHRSAPMPMYDREVPVLHGAAFIGGTHNNSLVDGHGDLDCIDTPGVDMAYMLQSVIELHSDRLGGGIDFLMRGHEHHEGNEVNVLEDAVYKENQVISQMEQNVAPSNADVGLSDNCLALGREFPDIDALRNALSDMAVSTGREYKHVRTSPSKLKMKCKAEGCNWCIQATRLSNSPAFKVVKHQEVHTCMVRTNSGDKDHPQATVRWILSKMQTNIEKDPEMEPKKIVNEIKDRYGILISYNKAVKAKTKALEVMRGGLEKMSSLPDVDICRALKVELERDSTTICKLGVNSDGGSFQHLFWSFKACIDALRNHLRPVVYVGSVHTDIGVLMYACGVDGDGFEGNLIDVGFGFYYYNYREDEKCSKWETYLGWLKEFVLPPSTAAGIPFTIVTRFEETGGLTGAVENVLPHLHHFFTPHSVACYFANKFEDNTNLYYRCHQACATYSTEKCETALQKIKSINKEAYSWLLSSRRVGPKSHWAIAFSPNKHVLAAFWETDRGFGFNWTLLSIIGIVESSREMVANYFSERRREGGEAASRTTTGLAPGVLEDIQWAKDHRADYKVESIDGLKYQITSKGYGDREVVDLEEKSCTCGEFQATEYPCRHARMMIAHLGLDERNYMSHHQWYSLDTYLATYAGTLPPPISDHILKWDTPIPGLLPPKRKKVGRPRKFKGKCHKTV